MPASASQRWHRWLGIVVLLPVLLWATTGAVFLFKPGYRGAYEQLSIPADDNICAASTNILGGAGQWQELRLQKTVLGCHRLQKLQGHWQHLHITGELWVPSIEDIRALMQSAVAHNPERYGEIISLAEQPAEQWQAHTSTGVVLTLTWPELRIRQSGRDTRLINALYKIHYLQPTAIKAINQAFASTVLIALVVTVLLGARQLLRKR